MTKMAGLKFYKFSENFSNLRIFVDRVEPWSPKIVTQNCLMAIVLYLED
jgi:hypothetical protein